MSEPEIIETPAGPARLLRSRRTTLAISVLPDGVLELTAPRLADLAAIRQRVEKRLTWVERQRRQFREMNAVRPEGRYVTGATHRYLGRQFRLKITFGPLRPAWMQGGYLHLQLPQSEASIVKRHLEDWYRRQAQVQFARRISGWEDWCRARGLPLPRLRILNMPKRWGSMGSEGVLRLNPILIRAPSACVDYVITHEICHLVHPDHGPEFQALLRQLCPDWRCLKARLESFC
jgi:predicted metal-dependent hydrolase